MNGVSIIKTGEVGYAPLNAVALSEDEAQLLVAQIVKTLKAQIMAVPIWQQYEFSRRAQTILEKEQITTWEELAVALKGARTGAVNIRNVGPRVQQEWGDALAVHTS